MACEMSSVSQTKSDLSFLHIHGAFHQNSEVRQYQLSWSFNLETWWNFSNLQVTIQEGCWCINIMPVAVHEANY